MLSYNLWYLIHIKAQPSFLIFHPLMPPFAFASGHLRWRLHFSGESLALFTCSTLAQSLPSYPKVIKLLRQHRPACHHLQPCLSACRWADPAPFFALEFEIWSLRVYHLLFIDPLNAIVHFTASSLYSCPSWPFQVEIFCFTKLYDVQCNSKINKELLMLAFSSEWLVRDIFLRHFSCPSLPVIWPLLLTARQQPRTSFTCPRILLFDGREPTSFSLS